MSAYGLPEKNYEPHSFPEIDLGYDVNLMQIPSPAYSHVGDMVPERRSTGAQERFTALLLRLEHMSDPPLPNGWRYVEDDNSLLTGNNTIPAQKFTAYFAAKTVPLAHRANSRVRAHDEGHRQPYQEMFESQLFSDTVVLAATNAGTDEDLCKIFAAALDKLGDYLVFLQAGLDIDSTEITEQIRHLVILASATGTETEALDADVVIQQQVATILNELEIEQKFAKAEAIRKQREDVRKTARQSVGSLKNLEPAKTHIAQANT